MREKLIVFALLIIGALVGLAGFITPKIDTLRGNYSIEQAWEYLSVIAAEPRPNGSENNQKVRKFIIETLEKEDITAVECSRIVDNPRGEKVNLHNIYADLGFGGDASVLFMAHYDSFLDSPGAGDNGMSVASLLEGATKIVKDSGYKTNIKLLFTDAEELGAIGAKSFTEEIEGYLDDVVAVINVEGFGNGPVTIVEGANLSSVYFETANKPVGYSSVSALPKKSLRFDTGAFMPKYPSMTIATITGSMNYHSPRDNIINASYKSQAHSIDTVYSMMKNIASMDKAQVLELISRKDKVFFNITYGLNVSYPEVAGIVMAGLAVVLFFICAFRNRSYDFSLQKALVTVLGTAVVPALFYALTWVMLRVFTFLTWNKFIHLAFYKRGATWVSFVIILIALPVVCVYFKKLLKYAGSSATIAIDFLLVGLGLGLSIIMPGGAYLLYVPMIFISGLKLIEIKLLNSVSVLVVAIITAPLIYLGITVLGAQVVTLALISIVMMFTVSVYTDAKRCL